MRRKEFKRPPAKNAGVREQAKVLLQSKLSLSTWRVSHGAMSRVASRHRRSMQTFSFTLWILNALILSHGSDFRADERKGLQLPETQSSSRQRWLEGVSTVDELLELLYPEYTLAQRCLKRMVQGMPALPLYEEETGRFPREASEPHAVEAIKAIVKEIELTACQPREVCVEVAKEYAESTSNFFVPRCVSVHRCGGCCYNEGQECINSSYTLVEKTVLELVPVQNDKSIIKTTFVNHTSCECQPKSPLHTISRRATANNLLSRCSPPDVPCSLGLVWNPTECKCMHLSPLSAREMAPLDTALLTLCGPNRTLNRQCECECRNGLTQASCGPRRMLDEESCKCACRAPPPTEPCPPNQHWNRETCSCVCQANCTFGYSPVPEKCHCKCRNSPRICRLMGMTFRPENCSCQQRQKKTSYREDGKQKFSMSSLGKHKLNGPV
ncbi:vascular endothelial growth factor C-like [Brienomyrus brachyistius]|uniref:vascular endothelial growth factor C-like n=1 Tax=Brienomyrus brachyistius TaxID=42636 RepID=UPI0020B2AF89|nr:vascular endothelial growth factor C-like [Brienomyrus brachyistius]